MMNIEDASMTFAPIGFVSSWFKVKNGTPRQGGLSSLTRGTVTILDSIYNNPSHSLEGLEEFSHVWLIWVFDKNNGQYKKAKIAPPRLGGKRVGVFSTRTPHRANPIGLTLAKLEKVEGATLHLSGLDLLDGTPILDIKPFIPDYDTAEGLNSRSLSHSHLMDKKGSENETDTCPVDYTADAVNENSVDAEEDNSQSLTSDELSRLSDNGFVHNCIDVKPEDVEVKASSELVQPSEGSTSPTEKCSNMIPKSEESKSCTELNHKKDQCSNLSETDAEPVKLASWLQTKNQTKLPVRFTPDALSQLKEFSVGGSEHQFTFLKSTKEAEEAIADILREDPRSIYRKNKCLDRLYFVMIDSMHVTAWFDDESGVFEVLRVMPKAMRNRN